MTTTVFAFQAVITEHQCACACGRFTPIMPGAQAVTCTGHSIPVQFPVPQHFDYGQEFVVGGLPHLTEKTA